MSNEIPMTKGLSLRRLLKVWVFLAIGHWTFHICAAEVAEAPAAKGTGRGYRMDYGPALAYTINCRNFGDARKDNLALKGLAIRLGSSNEAAVCFDTELLRYGAGWSGGFLDISHTHLDSSKGSHEAFVDGSIQFTTPVQAGWSTNHTFGDRNGLRWKGYFRSGRRIVLNYEVAGVEIWESPAYQQISNQWALVRQLRLAGPRPELHMLVSDNLVVTLPGGEGSEVFQVAFVPQSKQTTTRKNVGIDP